MPQNLASLSPARFNSTVVPIMSMEIDRAVVSELKHHSGNEYPTLVAVAGAGPRIMLRAPFREVFDVLGFGVVNLTTLDLYLATFAGLVRQSGNNHIKFGLNTSCTAAAQIVGASVSQDGSLIAEVEVFPLSNDGVANPLIRTASQALPIVASEPEWHTLGPVSINGTVYSGLRASNIQLNPTLEVVRGDGALYPIIAARTQGQPSITLEHSDPVALSALLDAVGVAATSNVICYFRQHSTATGVIDTGATSVSITCASGRVEPMTIAAEQGRVATYGAMVRGLSSSSTHPFAVSVSATSPALP